MIPLRGSGFVPGTVRNNIIVERVIEKIRSIADNFRRIPIRHIRKDSCFATEMCRFLCQFQKFFLERSYSLFYFLIMTFFMPIYRQRTNLENNNTFTRYSKLDI